MVIPAVAMDGVRETVNARLSTDETIWNFRSGWNVAALNCLEPQHEPILTGYKSFLQKFNRSLSTTNTAIDRQYRTEHGAGYKRIRDTESTKVYNYFALPPTLDDFCDVTLAISNEYLLAPPSDLQMFAMSALPRMEATFENFYRAYEQYRTDLANWNAQYAPQYANSTYAAPTVQATQSTATVNMSAQSPASPPQQVYVPPSASTAPAQATTSPAQGVAVAPAASVEPLAGNTPAAPDAVVVETLGSGSNGASPASAPAETVMAEPASDAGQPRFVSQPVVQTPGGDGS